MNRRPVVAGQFYPGDAADLSTVVSGLLAKAGPRAAEPAILAMVPHAGYVYSGEVCGKTLGRADLAETILLLGPNHTGRGERLAVWPAGAWEVPGCALPIDRALTEALLDADPAFQPDMNAHLGEHSLEVLLPFLCALDENTRIAAVTVREGSPKALAAAGVAAAEAVRSLGRPVSIVVSSDMSHYLPHEEARRMDAMALEKIAALDPEGLYAVVRERNISMCGVLPMTLGLHAARELGAASAELIAYATSGEASGDYARVVGYAGAVVS